MRSTALAMLVAAGTTLVLWTEVLSALGRLSAAGVMAGWVVFLGCAGFWLAKRKGRFGWPSFEGVGLVPVAVAVVLGVAAVTALVAPPNTWDALAYHLPRVVYWAQQGSVEFFRTTYQNQNGMPPLAEYAMLHGWLVTGGDRWVNLPQWMGFAGSAVAASLVAQRLGAGVVGQWLVALFAVSLPNAILQASGAKNDLVLALWLICAYYFLDSWRLEARWHLLLFGALAVGLAVATKGTAYLFLPPIVFGACRWRLSRALAPIAVAVVLLNGAFYLRNYRASGSPLGFDSAHGDGRYRWRNGELSWRIAASNVLRHASEQLGSTNPEWNQWVYRGVVFLHAGLGLDPSDPAATWWGAAYGPPKSTRHEADAGNPWHLAVLCGSVLVLCRRRGSADSLWLAGSVLGAFVLFCVALRWQPFQARLLTPLFLLASPLVAVPAAWLGARLPPCGRLVAPVLVLFLVRGPLFGNWLRPWAGAGSIWRVSREEQYFADIREWGSANETRPAVDRLAASGCRLVGVDSRRFEPEYPYLALMRRRVPEARFVHLGAPGPKPCAVICLGCEAKEPAAIQMGRSVFRMGSE